MKQHDFIDWFFIFIYKITKFAYEKDLIKAWFNILSWSVITGFFYSIAEHQHSFLFGWVGTISIFLLFFYCLHIMNDIFDNFYSKGTLIKFIIILTIGLSLIIFIYFFIMVVGIEIFKNIQFKDFTINIY